MMHSQPRNKQTRERHLNHHWFGLRLQRKTYGFGKVIELTSRFQRVVRTNIRQELLLLYCYYTIHGSSNAVEHWKLLTNETLNIYTAMLQALLVLYIAMHLLKYDDCTGSREQSENTEGSKCLLDGARPLLLFALVLHSLGMICIVFYHTVCTIASLYHFASACDLVGVGVSGLAMAVALVSSQNSVLTTYPHSLLYQICAGSGKNWSMAITASIKLPT